MPGETKTAVIGTEEREPTADELKDKARELVQKGRNAEKALAAANQEIKQFLAENPGFVDSLHEQEKNGSGNQMEDISRLTYNLSNSQGSWNNNGETFSAKLPDGKDVEVRIIKLKDSKESARVQVIDPTSSGHVLYDVDVKNEKTPKNGEKEWRTYYLNHSYEAGKDENGENIESVKTSQRKPYGTESDFYTSETLAELPEVGIIKGLLEEVVKNPQRVEKQEAK